jgi:hypothetical protein
MSMDKSSTPHIHSNIIQISKNQKNKNGASNYRRNKVNTINLDSSSLAADELNAKTNRNNNLEELRREKEKQDKLCIKDTRSKSQTISLLQN